MLGERNADVVTGLWHVLRRSIATMDLNLNARPEDRGASLDLDTPIVAPPLSRGKRAMIFPSGFPDRAQSAVVAAQIRAIARMENELAYHMLNPGPKAELLGKLGRGYLMEILAVFAKQACELGHAGTWTARHIDIEVMAFMRQLAADFRSEYSHIGMPAMLDNWSAIEPAVLRELKLSDKWKAYQAELLEIAESQMSLTPASEHVNTDQPKTIQPVTPPETASGSSVPKIGDKLDDIVLREDVSHEELASRMGLGRTTYFEVKAGRGGRKSKKKVQNFIDEWNQKHKSQNRTNRD
jgi:hypothetical protein